MPGRLLPTMITRSRFRDAGPPDPAGSAVDRRSARSLGLRSCRGPGL